MTSIRIYAEDAATGKMTACGMDPIERKETPEKAIIKYIRKTFAGEDMNAFLGSVGQIEQSDAWSATATIKWNDEFSEVVTLMAR